MLKIQNQQFAEEIGLKKGAMSQIIRGKNKPTYETLFNIISKFNIPSRFFFDESCQLIIDNGEFKIANDDSKSTNQSLIEENKNLRERLEMMQEKLAIKEEKIALLEEKLDSLGVKRRASG